MVQDISKIKKMVLFLADGRYGWLFSLGLLLLAAAHVPLANGQQQGVSLMLLGQTIPNNSLVNLDDLAYQDPNLAGFTQDPTNANGRETLMCVTDVVACCESPELGNWHLPAGSVGGSGQFRINRGQNEEINGQQLYGSVRLWRRYTPNERGLFRCELPDANGVNQNLYVNILFFADMNGIFVTVTSSGPTATAGETYSLTCSATLHSRNPPLPETYIMPPPTFEWFFGPNGNAPIPSGLTTTATDLGTDNIYRSTLQFSPLSQSHTGNYTCRLGAGRLVNSNTFTVTPPSISAAIIPNFNERLVVGQTDNTLTCNVSGVGNLNPTTDYQWTRNDGSTQTQVGSSRILTLPSLTLSSAGEYSCHATVGSALLTGNIEASAGTPQRVEIQIPDPESVTVSNNGGDIVRDGSSNTVTCTVELGSAVMESELSLLMVSAQLSRDGTPLNLTGPTVTGTTHIYRVAVSSFSESDIGNYSCNATVRSQSTSNFLIGIGQLMSQPYEIRIGNPPAPAPSSSNAGAIAGGVIVVIIALAAVAVAVVALLFWFTKRRSSVPYKQAYGGSKPPVAYTRPLRPTDVALTGVAKITKPTITKFPSDTNITEGEGVYFKFKVSGEPRPTVHNGEPIKADYAREIEADGSLAIVSAELKHSGVYKAVAANQHGSEEREVKLTVNEEGITSTDAATMNGMVSSRPIPIPEFGKYVADLHANSNQPFKDLYQALDTGEGGHSIEYATNRERKPLNRFGNIVVYDDNRIVLKPLADASDCQRDYINACYVDGYSVPNKFIATQGFCLDRSLCDLCNTLSFE